MLSIIIIHLTISLEYLIDAGLLIAQFIMFLQLVDFQDSLVLHLLCWNIISEFLMILTQLYFNFAL